MAEPTAKERNAAVSNIKTEGIKQPVVEAPKEVKASPPVLSLAVETEASKEKPLVSVVAIDRNEGFIRKSGRVLGRFFRKVSQALRLY